MELTDNNFEEVRPISNVCPSCKSDSWKSAKMVVMEGSTHVTGTIDGKLTEPGIFSGAGRNVFLADRWFSMDQRLEAEFELKSTSGLVEGVRQLMLAHGAGLQMPVVPFALRGSGGQQVIRLTEPQRPTEKPLIPNEPQLASDQPWYIHFLREILLAGLATWILSFMFATAALIIFVICVPVCLGRSFTGNDRQKADYESNVKAYPELVEKTIKDHGIACAKYEVDIVNYAAKKTLLDQYEAAVLDIKTRRELIWEQARVCMRCGTAYLNRF